MAAFPLRSIVIVGGGVSGWMAAATLARVLGASCRVRVVAAREDAALGGAVASVPSLHRLWRLLGVDEPKLLRATNATFRLGTMYRDWTRVGSSYFAGFGPLGARLDAVPFLHHWLRVAAQGERIDIEQFSMSAQAAKLGRFAPPSDDPASVLSLFAYAWHFDAQSLRDFLRRLALDAGATEIAGAPADVELDADGCVGSLLLADGRREAADFFVDCGGLPDGPAGLDLGYEDWSEWLPCDRLQLVRGATDAALPPYSESQADTNGWRFSIPQRGWTARGHVYAGEFIDDQAVAAGLGVHEAPRVIRLARGRPRDFWVRNWLCLPGDALDPLETTSLHLAQTGITRFLAHFPVHRASPTDAAEYNRLTAEEYDRIRDLLALHYHVTARSDSPFWNRCRAMRAPEPLARRLELFLDSGRLAIGEDEHCGADAWISVLLGHGLTPATYDPLADAVPFAPMRDALTRFAAQIQAAATALPSHRDFLARGARQGSE